MQATQSAYRSHHRGMVLLMVVVSLVLMTMVGAAYMQVARQDRVSVSVQTETHIDMIANATVAYIADVLKSDLMQLNDEGEFFLLDGVTDEPYDYPYTNADYSFTVTDMNGEDMSDLAEGGRLDDTWLASSEPEFTSDPTWRHITNLNGVFLKLPAEGSKIHKPLEQSVNNQVTSNQWRRDTQVPITGNSPVRLTYADTNYETYGADADGDGILDSKWTWAPIRQIAGKRYVMAVRIIDNSAMINLNTASSQVSAANTYFGSYDKQRKIDIGSDAPRWLFPSELDFGNFAYLVSTTTVTSSQMETYWEHRFVDRLSNHTRLPWFGNNLYPYYGVNNSRFDYWFNAGRLWDNRISGNYNIFAIPAHEAEFRFRNGLNKLENQTIAELVLPEILTRRNSTESSYLDVVNVTNIQDYFTREPRHQMTTINGSSTLTSPLPGHAQPNLPVTRLNVNKLFSKGSNGVEILDNDALTDFANLVYDVIQIGKDNINTQFKIQSQTQLNNNQEYAYQFAASFADHFDRDNISTKFNGMNGWEAWPYISEVYTQMPATMHNGQFRRQGKGVVQATFTPIPVGKVGYAIEIINPHTRPITLANIQLMLHYQQKSDNKYVDVELPAGKTLDLIAGNAVRHANHGDTWLYPGQRIIIYHNSDGGPTTGRLNDMDDVLKHVIDIDDFTPWESGKDYVAGKLYRHDSDGDGKDEVFECLADHHSTGSNKPTTVYDAIYGDYKYHASHEIWRRKLIVVDGGTWPVDASDFKDYLGMAGNMDLRLKGYEQANGVVGPADWPYQFHRTCAYPLGQALNPLSIIDDVALWQQDKVYADGDLVYADGPAMPPYANNFAIFRCVNPTDAGLAENAPINATGHWVRDSAENMYYLQSHHVGLVDGIHAAAFRDPMAPVNQTRYWAQYITNKDNGLARYLHDFDSIGWQSKHINPPLLSVTKPQPAGTLVRPSPSPLSTAIGYFYRDFTPGDNLDDCYMVCLYDAYKPKYYETFIDNKNSQLLIDDQGVTYTNWEINRLYEIGDVVRERTPMTSTHNGDRFFICTKAHTAQGNPAINKPGVIAGNWPTYWKEHWRTSEHLYVDSVAKLAHVMVAKSGQPTMLVLGASDLPSVDYLLPPVNPPFTQPMQLEKPWNIPHMSALMDRLTIHEPNADTLDNDGDQVIDNPEELLVPGRININTAPAHLLKQILPVPDPTVRASLVDSIDTYRHTVSGIPNIYQLTYATRPLIEYSAPIDNVTLAGVVIDFQNPDMITSDGIANDQEELMLPTQWLSGVASTRSDIFTAYILIRGYPAGDFSRGTVETRQMVVVFDRSNVINAQTLPKILSMSIYE